jgi:hypothetical protein
MLNLEILYEYIENFLGLNDEGPYIKENNLNKNIMKKSKSLNDLYDNYELNDCYDRSKEILYKMENINKKLNILNNNINLSSKINIGIFLSSFLFYFYKNKK